MTTALRGYDVWLQSGNPYDAVVVCTCGHDSDEHDEVTFADPDADDDGQLLTIVRCSIKGCLCDEFVEMTEDDWRAMDPRIP